MTFCDSFSSLTWVRCPTSRAVWTICLALRSRALRRASLEASHNDRRHLADNVASWGLTWASPSLPRRVLRRSRSIISRESLRKASATEEGDSDPASHSRAPWVSSTSRALASTARARLCSRSLCRCSSGGTPPPLQPAQESSSESTSCSNPPSSPRRPNWTRARMASRMPHWSVPSQSSPSSSCDSSWVEPVRTTRLAMRAVSTPVRVGSVRRQRLSMPNWRASIRSFLRRLAAISRARRAFSCSEGAEAEGAEEDADDFFRLSRMCSAFWQYSASRSSRLT
mmetsp:Transcript_11589/g.27352  ORF Transcript_11589/g.27352 Transcript_11589/m.27352 type:complete len:283 (+) Transcript_11589:903-1751(+)